MAEWWERRARARGDGESGSSTPFPPSAPSGGEFPIEALQRLCEAAIDALPACGVGVSVMIDGGLREVVVCAGDASARIEELQTILGEGPAVEAFVTGRSVLVADLELAAERWSAFTTAVREHGVRAAFAFPLQIGALRVGVLCAYRAQAGHLSVEGLRAGHSFADLALAALLTSQDRAATGQPASVVDQAVSHHAVVHQAQGMVMVQLGSSLATATLRLRAYAFAHGRTLSEVAQDVLTRTLEFRPESPDDLPPGPRPADGEAGPVEGQMEGKRMPGVTAEQLAHVFVEVADTLVDEFDLVDFLQRVTVHATELADSTAGGLLLADIHDRLQVLAASDERTQLLELFQVQTDEGPCRDCLRTGQRVTHSELSTASSRWPRFAPRAVAAGFRSVHAFPLRLRGEVIGALGLFDSGSRTLDPARVRIVQALVDVATIALLQERTIHRAGVLTEQLQAALNSRIIIEQAKGALAQMYTISVDEAYELLRQYVHHHRLGLTEVARSIVTDPAGVPDLRVPAADQLPAPRPEAGQGE